MRPADKRIRVCENKTRIVAIVRSNSSLSKSAVAANGVPGILTNRLT